VNFRNQTFVLRFAVALTLFMHSVPGMLNGGVHAFGNLYLNEVGFSPLGVPLAWAIKLSHAVAAICFLMDRYVKPAALATLFVLAMGIVMIHAKEGWYVVGGGRNGVEFNVLLMLVLVAILFPNGIGASPSAKENTPRPAAGPTGPDGKNVAGKGDPRSENIAVTM
jgi:putative oxidoreductase